MILRQYLLSRRRDMMARCYNPQCRSYKNYGARGIVVESWLQDRENYVEYLSSLPGAKMGLDIDRIDNNLGYTRGNLRWISRKENLRNTRHCHFVEFNGERLTVLEFAAKYMQASRTRFYALQKQGLTLAEIAAFVPDKRYQR